MNFKSIKNKKSKKNLSDSFNYMNDCKASEASTEIMIDRFFKESEIGFPFLNN